MGDKLKNEAKAEESYRQKFRTGKKDNSMTMEERRELAKLRKQGRAKAYKEAAEDGGKVLSCNVSIHTAICPECGRVYVSGGTTSTKIAHPVEQKKNPLKDQMNQMAGNIARGLNMDMTA